MRQAALRSEKVRVFFALWPDAEAAMRMHTIAHRRHAKLGGRLTREDSLHATLVFIGDIGLDRLPDLLTLPEGMQAPIFDVSFDTLACWRHNRIAYLGMRRMPEALRLLQLELAARVRAAGFAVDHRVFSPHITLIRKADCERMGDQAGEQASSETVDSAAKENPATEPVAWTVRDFVLVRSSMSANGSRYEQIGRWPLL
jgi:RNA 2',3'-cyclic 3'-phosphodiesterase